MTQSDTASGAEQTDTDCKIVDRKGLGETYYAVCTTHSCTQLGRHPHRRNALYEFVCDNGNGWRFIVQYEATDAPTMFDLSGLVQRVDSDRIAEHMGVHDGPPARIWRWIGDGEIEPITVTHVEGTGDWLRNTSDETAVATAYPQYAITGPDGTEYHRVTVALDEI